MQKILILIVLFFSISAQANCLKHNPDTKTILIADKANRLQLVIDYSKGCKLSQVIVNGKNTLSPLGVYTSIKTGAGQFTSLESMVAPKVVVKKNKIEISNIIYGDGKMNVAETWIFTHNDSQIFWNIERQYSQHGTLDNMAIPVWNFASLSTWKGGILNTGGMVWAKYLKNEDDTYGVHTNGVTFWNAESGDGFRIEANSKTGGDIAGTFSQGKNGVFRFIQYLTPTELGQRYALKRFVNGKADVFTPFEVSEGVSEISLEMSYVDYNKAYDRGTLTGIDAIAVRELLNTTGRYGVVDKNIIGANGWITNWKCLHEPFFAQIGMAVNDQYYTQNFASTLDQERDHAIEADGRVLARWHDEPEAAKSNYDFKTGYYDAPWGYTIDAQPSQVINTAELFQQTGDLNWLKAHKLSSEKVLEWLIKRDSNNNGIFEMLNNNTGDNTCSDWLDVVWASFENAFVNAQMYEALNLWSACEMVLGDQDRANYYSAVAARLKAAFNKPVQEGGFWNPQKKQYIYWRDKDGSLHGDNLVTPVNFAAIAFGICDDPQRVKDVLEQIETRSKAENLFHWPLCYDSFKMEEIYKPVMWPFPSYENGDIFPTWGYLGIRSYVKYDKNIALKYIKNILVQYRKDGLSSQRFSRKTQEGIGEDILAGISTTITALYRDIYGIRPKWNRMGLEPNMLKELNGTSFKYTLREEVYNIKLSENNYQLSTKNFSVDDAKSFGANMFQNTLLFYPGNQNDAELKITRRNAQPIKIEITEWDNQRNWTVNSKGSYQFVLTGLQPNAAYSLMVNGAKKQLYKSDTDGVVNFKYRCNVETSFSLR